MEESPQHEQHEYDIHGQIAQLARHLHGPAASANTLDPNTVLSEVAAAAVDILPGVDHAGITLVRRKMRGTRQTELESAAATGEIPKLFDDLQFKTGEGPCFEAIWEHRTIRIDDIETEQRWPAFTAAVIEHTPVRAVLSIQLFLTDQELGALNLQAEHTHAFDDATTVDLATNLATHAAIALSNARRGGQFRSALASRDIIGQAKGILMERFTIDAVAAFDLLRRLSQDTNTPISELADQLVNKDRPAQQEPLRQPVN